MQKKHLTKITDNISVCISVSPPSEPLQDTHKLKKWLSEQILYLLQHQFERLIHILYRLDIDEIKAKEAFNAKDDTTIASNIAELIIKREYEKHLTRIKYKNQPN